MKHYPEDYGLTADQLSQKYNRDSEFVVEHPDNVYGAEHPKYTRWDWIQRVAQRVTNTGYWAWVRGELEAEEDRDRLRYISPTITQGAANED